MRDLLYVIRYFHVVPPVSRLMMISFAVLTVTGGVVITVADGANAGAAIPILALQAFAASTGFAVLARRGYFDLLVVRGQPRMRIAIVQWVLSILPGSCCCLVLSAVHSAGHSGANPFLQPGTLVAFLMVSTIPWAANVALPRFAGAIGWLLLVCMAESGGVIWPDSVHEVLFPVALLGASLNGRIGAIAAALVLSAASMSLALTWVHRADIRLEAAQ